MPVEGTFGAGKQSAVFSGTFVAHVAQCCSPVSVPHAEEIEGFLRVALFCRPVERELCQPIVVFKSKLKEIAYFALAATDTTSSYSPSGPVLTPSK